MPGVWTREHLRIVQRGPRSQPHTKLRLTQAAQEQGLAVDACALQLLAQHVPDGTRRAELVALLQSWIDGADSEGQRETGEYLVRVLGEDRLSDRVQRTGKLAGARRGD